MSKEHKWAEDGYEYSVRQDENGKIELAGALSFRRSDQIEEALARELLRQVETSPRGAIPARSRQHPNPGE